jgi:magnesium transporter
MVVGPTLQPMGVMPLRRLLRTTRPVGISDIMETEIRSILAQMDQEKVAFMFHQYGLVSVTVVDGHGRLIDVIDVDDVDDVVTVIDEETEEDLLKFGGVR